MRWEPLCGPPLRAGTAMPNPQQSKDVTIAVWPVILLPSLENAHESVVLPDYAMVPSLLPTYMPT